MKVDGVPHRTAWLASGEGADGLRVGIIDQRKLPFRFATVDLRSVDEVAWAIREMLVRGAGCIGATAGFGMVLAAAEALGAGVASAEARERRLRDAMRRLVETRPTASNLRWAVERVARVLIGPEAGPEPGEWIARARAEALAIADEDVAHCLAIGRHGLELIRAVARRKPAAEPVRILTHCNAGWLAFVDVGSATAPIYAARDAGIPLHVWVDETRPRSQGARLTAWELQGEGIPHQVIADNAGGHLMQHGMVDLVLVGTDRTTAAGDVANKIGTYLKALAARDNGIPFYVALPSSSIDWRLRDGLRGIPIEERSPDELTRAEVLTDDGDLIEAALMPPGTPAANPAFDVTPARLVTALITERGACPASEHGLARLFPDHSAAEEGEAPPG